MLGFALMAGCNVKFDPPKQPDPPAEQTEQPAPPPPENPNPPNEPRGPKRSKRSDEERDTATKLAFRTQPYAADWSGVKAGDTVRVIGQYEKMRGDRVEFGFAGRYYGSRPVVPAAEVSAAFKTDLAAADAKYKGRVFVVEGVVASVSDRDLLLSGSKVAEPGAAPTTDPRVRAAKAAKATVTLDAKEVTTAKADAPYKGKVIEVTGAVDYFEFGPGTGATVSLHAVTPEGKILSGTVHCQLLEFEPWNRLTYDQTVTVRGKCQTVGNFTQLSDCVIVKEGTSPVIELTAEEFAKEYKADKKAADVKYYAKETGYARGKALLITGEITAWNTTGKVPQVTLAGTDGVKVNCYLAPGLSGFPSWEAPVGTKVQLLGQYAFLGNNDAVWMNLGIIRKVE
jgi:hypothetical protein